MAAPVAPEQTQPNLTGSSVTMEELEVASKPATEAPAPPDLSTVKLDGEGVPEELRGKTAAEAVALVSAFKKALQTSEDARKQGQTNLELAMRQAPQAPAPPAPPPELTPEQWTELFQADPVRAIDLRTDQRVKAEAANLEARLSQLVRGTAASIEQGARAAYPEEFALFGPEITQIAQSLPGGPAALSSPQAWDELISLVRGRKPNMERLFEARMAKTTGATQAKAQADEAASIGFQAAPVQRAAPPTRGGQIDDVERQIMSEMGMTEAEWLRWRTTT